MQLLFNYRDSYWYCKADFQERTIPKEAGCRWDPENKQWWTGDVAVASKLAAYANDEIRDGLVKVAEKRAERVAASRATDADIAIPLPAGLECLPFQRGGVAYAVDHRSTLFGDEMGLGKTIQAIALINVIRVQRVLIICPASLKLNWQRECEKWLYDKSLTIHVANGSLDRTANIVIVNYDILKKFSDDLLAITWDLIVCDEAHYCKNQKAQRTQYVKKLAKKAPRKVLLTGTPICNRPIELFSLLEILGSKLARNFWGYAKWYCDAHNNGYGWDFSGASHLDELQEKLREEVMVRRLKKDVLAELPAKRRQIIELPANGTTAQIKREQALQDKFAGQKQELKAQAELAKADENPAAYEKAVGQLQALTQVEFAEISKIRHDTALVKVPALIEHVKSILEETDKIVLFAHHHDVIDALKNGLLDYNPVSLTGADSIDARQQAVDAFQRDPNVRIFIGSIQASGVGITLTAASTVVFSELDWVPGNLSQAEDRCHRIGQTNSVLVQHVVLDGSIDAILAKTVVKKQEVIDRALDKEAARKQAEEQVAVESDVICEAPEGGVEEVFTGEQKDAILEMVRQVAGMCDGARAIDGVGFSRYDARIGIELARRSHLTDRQAALGKRVCKKYHRQISGQLYARVYGATE